MSQSLPNQGTWSTAKEPGSAHRASSQSLPNQGTWSTTSARLSTDQTKSLNPFQIREPGRPPRARSQLRCLLVSIPSKSGNLVDRRAQSVGPLAGSVSIPSKSGTLVDLQAVAICNLRKVSIPSKSGNLVDHRHGPPAEKGRAVSIPSKSGNLVDQGKVAKTPKAKKAGLNPFQIREPGRPYITKWITHLKKSQSLPNQGTWSTGA